MGGERERRLLGGRYELQDRIACGGMGEVWRGRDAVLHRDVAVKVLRSEYADDPTFVERFRGEARHAAALSHPNIAAVLDYGEASEAEAGEHLAFLVMELVDGAPLSTRLAADGPLGPEAALSVLQQTAAGLAEAHRRGLVHRDVKPANILVRRDGAVKLTDFGIARSADSIPLTGTGQVVGTAQYMSPEQAKGEPATPASDVYALGLVGYETLTGHAAFEGTNPVTVALKHVVEEPRPLPYDLPDDVRGLIGSALAKDPGDRLPDGAAFLTAVEETLAAHPHAADGDAVGATRPARIPAPAPVPAPAPAPAGAVRAPGGASPSRRRTLAVLAPLLVLLVAAGALVLVLGGAGGAEDPPPGEGAAAAGEGAAAADGPSAAADQRVLLSAADHVGRPFPEVRAELAGLGLRVVRVDQVTGDQPAETVLAVAPAGARLDDGDEVRVTVAVSPPAPAAAPAPEAPEVPSGPAADVPAPGAGEAPGSGAAPGTEAGAGTSTGAGGGASAPAEPSADDPAVTDPGSSGAAPSDPGPSDPAPSDPAPSDPSGSNPAPSDPAPSEPSGSEPAPSDPGTTPSTAQTTASTSTQTGGPSVGDTDGTATGQGTAAG
ncbi:protein kinase domain-containing protein [Blastococcus sp. SYSU D00695]